MSKGYSRLHSGLPSRNIAQKVSEQKSVKAEILTTEGEKEKRDVFNVNAALLLPDMWNALGPALFRKEIKIQKPESLSEMHSSLYHAYHEVVQDAEHVYSQTLREGMKLQKNDPDSFSDVQKRYANVMLNAPEGVDIPNLSSLDAVHLWIHLAEVIAEKSKTFEEFEGLMYSKGADHFLKSLLVNSRMSIIVFLQALSKDKKGFNIESSEYHFDPDIVSITDAGVVVNPVWIQVIKDLIQKHTKDTDVRYCPALFAGDVVNSIFAWMKSEITKQYQRYWNDIKV